jgi:hypothetical protein
LPIARIWEVVLCAGDGIRSRDALANAGIAHQDAAALERELAEAERKLDPQHVAMFSRFEGMLMMDGSGALTQVVDPICNSISIARQRDD